MSNYKINFSSDNVIQLLEKVEQHYRYVHELNVRNLPVPTCVSNEFILIKEFINDKWLTDFPDFEFVCKELEKGNLLFSVPYDEQHYLYYHLLRAYKKLSKQNRLVTDFSETLIPYTSITDYLLRHKEDAREFFENYLDNRSSVSLIENKDAIVLKNNAVDLSEKDKSLTGGAYVIQPCQGCHKP